MKRILILAGVLVFYGFSANNGQGLDSAQIKKEADTAVRLQKTDEKINDLLHSLETKFAKGDSIIETAKKEQTDGLAQASKTLASTQVRQSRVILALTLAELRSRDVTPYTIYISPMLPIRTITVYESDVVLPEVQPKLPEKKSIFGRFFHWKK